MGGETLGAQTWASHGVRVRCVTTGTRRRTDDFMAKHSDIEGELSVGGLPPLEELLVRFLEPPSRHSS